MATFFRVVGIILALILMVGFGLCGLMGIVSGFGNSGYDGLGLVFGFIGLAISAAFAFAVRVMVKPNTKSGSGER